MAAGGTTEATLSGPPPGQGLLGSAVLDLAGRVVSITHGVERILGYPAGRFVGQSAALVVREERRGALGSLLERVRRGEDIPAYPTVLRRMDGTTVPVELSAGPLLDAEASVSGVSVTLRDLSPPSGLSGSPSEGVEQVMAGTGALAFDVDLSGSRPLWWARGDCGLLSRAGIDRSVGWAALDDLSDEARDRVLSVATSALGGTRPGSSLHRVLAPDGASRWLAVSSRVVEESEGTPTRIHGVALDVTDQYQALGGKRQAEATEPLVLRMRFPQEVIEYVSSSAEHFTGFTPEELLEGGAELAKRCLDPAVLEQIRHDQETGNLDGSSYEYRTLRRDGSPLWVRTSIRVLENGAEGELHEIVSTDVHHAKLVELEVSQLMLTDALTGMASRIALEAAWDELRAQGAQDRWSLLAHVDLDRFGLVNAGLGMVAGDEMLRLTGQSLRQLVSESAIVARMGADDFIVLESGLADRDEALSLAGELVCAGGDPMHIGGRDVYGTVSVGATLIDPAFFTATASLDDHLAEAHVAMRAAEARNGGCAEIFVEGMRAEAQAKIETHTALRQGMDRGQFVLHYQPIVELRTGLLVGAEALVRWEHPTRGLLLPSEFISLAEETGSILELGSWVIGEACRSAVTWPTGPAGDVRVAVNLSARQLSAPNLVNRVAEAVEAAGLAPDRLVLEITETSVIHDLDGAGWTLRRLGDIGVHFALDDFGTGYSSLAYLVQLPIDRVKVDRSLVAGLPDAPHSQAVIAGVVGMTEAMGIYTIAEGVESAEQLAALNNLGCQLAQGFYFSPPVTAEQLKKFIEQGPNCW